MEYIHLLSREQWEPKYKRFASVAFKPSSDGSGISVFEKRCAENTTGSICAHIREFYPNVSEEPDIFWHVPEDFVREPVQIKPTLSDSGDKCHRDIVGLTRKQAKNLF